MVNEKRSVITAGSDFQYEEFIYPYHRFLESSFQVDVVVEG